MFLGMSWSFGMRVNLDRDPDNGGRSRIEGPVLGIGRVDIEGSPGRGGAAGDSQAQGGEQNKTYRRGRFHALILSQMPGSEGVFDRPGKRLSFFTPSGKITSLKSKS